MMRMKIEFLIHQFADSATISVISLPNCVVNMIKLNRKSKSALSNLASGVGLT